MLKLLEPRNHLVDCLSLAGDPLIYDSLQIAKLPSQNRLRNNPTAHFVADGNALRFRLPSDFAKNGVEAVRITLNGCDTYDLVFSNVSGLDVTEIATVTGIYAACMSVISLAKATTATSCAVIPESS